MEVTPTDLWFMAKVKRKLWFNNETKILVSPKCFAFQAKYTPDPTYIICPQLASYKKRKKLH